MEGDCNVYAHTSLWMRPTGEWSINAKMVYTWLPSPEHSWSNCYGYGYELWMWTVLTKVRGKVQGVARLFKMRGGGGGGAGRDSK